MPKGKEQPKFSACAYILNNVTYPITSPVTCSLLEKQSWWWVAGGDEEKSLVLFDTIGFCSLFINLDLIC